MKARKPIYKAQHFASCILMVLTLAWLTISTPFVYEEMQEKYNTGKQVNSGEGEEDCPLANSAEEKSEGSLTTVSEYLHDISVHDHSFVILETFYKCHPSDLYLAFHPDYFSPPPEV